MIVKPGFNSGHLNRFSCQLRGQGRDGAAQLIGWQVCPCS
nr:MAG TPA: hypothetical protein [Caudoviricetes sp.]